MAAAVRGLSLRRRLLVGYGLVAVLVVVAGWLVLALQRNYLLAQVDERLERQVGNAVAMVDRATGEDQTGTPGRRAGMLVDSYLGVLRDGALTTVSAPADDPDLVPDLGGKLPESQPSTVPTASGQAHQMRIVSSHLPDGRVVVLGRSLAEVDAAMLQLTVTMAVIGIVVLAVVGLVFWWMIRLGLAPIAAVTAVARSLRGGQSDARVPPFPDGTEAHDLGEAFNELVDANQATNAMLRQFVADASHELRTPLTTLRGYADLASSGGLPDPQAVDDAMRRIRAEAARMTRLVEDLLLLAALDRSGDTDQRPLTRVAVDLSHIVADVGSDLAVLAPDRRVHVAAGTGICVPGDPDRLTQLVTILATNALRHTPGGTPVELTLSATPALVRLEVTDAGPGVPATDAQRVFDRFYRTDTARDRATGGSGLGLAIAAAITAAHGGRIGVTSPVPGRVDPPGARFWVELPVG